MCKGSIGEAFVRLQEVVSRLVEKGDEWKRFLKGCESMVVPMPFDEGLHWEAVAALGCAEWPCGEGSAPKDQGELSIGENPDPPPSELRPEAPPPPPTPRPIEDGHENWRRAHRVGRDQGGSFTGKNRPPSLQASLLTLPSITLLEMIENLQIGTWKKRDEAQAVLTLCIKAGLRKLGWNEDHIERALELPGAALLQLMKCAKSGDRSAVCILKRVLLAAGDYNSGEGG